MTSADEKTANGIYEYKDVPALPLVCDSWFADPCSAEAYGRAMAIRSYLSCQAASCRSPKPLSSRVTNGKKHLPISVLIDKGTGSSGETVAVAFRGRANTRFFGEHTSGASTSTQGFKLSDGANIVLATAVSVDRNGKVYPSGIKPDKTIPGGDKILPSDEARAMAVFFPGQRHSVGGNGTRSMRNLQKIRKFVLLFCFVIALAGFLNPVAGLNRQKSEPPSGLRPVGQERKAGDLTFTPVKLEHEGQNIPAEMGRLVVKENRRNASPNLIEIAFGRLKSTSSKPGPPLVFLNGGPGQPATSLARIPDFLNIFLKLRESGDVILLDIRGAGLSTPLLVHRAAPPLPHDAFINEEAALRLFKERARAAAEYFHSQDVDLSAYNTVEAADDIEDIRQALGVQKLDLLGFSYGTHLALSVIRRHGEHINRAVLVGTEGPNHTLKLPSTSQKHLETLSKLVARDPVIGKKVPSMTALLKRILSRLEKEPVTLPITAASTNETLNVIVSNFALQLIIEQDLGDANDLPLFPALFYSIDKGDYSILKRFVEKRFTRRAGFPILKDVMDLASGATRERQAQIKAEAKRSLLGNVMNFPYPDIGEAYGFLNLGDQFRSPVRTNVATLFISGTLDVNTPPFQAQEVRQGFKRSVHLIVKNAGHESMLPNQLVQQTILDFLRGYDVTRVKIALPKLRFLPVTNPDKTNSGVRESCTLF